jgi:hypothetical protein
VGGLVSLGLSTSVSANQAGADIPDLFGGGCVHTQGEKHKCVTGCVLQGPPLYMTYVGGKLSRLSMSVGRAVMRAVGNEVYDGWGYVEYWTAALLWHLEG